MKLFSRSTECELKEPSPITGEVELHPIHFLYAGYLSLLVSGAATYFFLQDPERYSAMLQQLPRTIAMGFGLK
jgi:hypothetical protein